MTCLMLYLLLYLLCLITFRHVQKVYDGPVMYLRRVKSVAMVIIMTSLFVWTACPPLSSKNKLMWSLNQNKKLHMSGLLRLFLLDGKW